MARADPRAAMLGMIAEQPGMAPPKEALQREARPVEQGAVLLLGLSVYVYAALQLTVPWFAAREWKRWVWAPLPVLAPLVYLQYRPSTSMLAFLVWILCPVAIVFLISVAVASRKAQRRRVTR